MTQTILVATLFAEHELTSGLEWVAGHAGKQRPLHQPKPQIGSEVDRLLVGYMNCIHAPSIQVLGNKELDYLNKLGKNAHADVIVHLFSDDPAAIIVTDGLNPPASLKRLAEDTGTPLWSARAKAHDVIERFTYHLKTTFTEHITTHGVFMEIIGVGILITGESGIGKSELALDLLSRGHRLIADDAPEFYRADPDIIIGSCPPVLRDFLEVRGLGVLNIRAMFGESAVKQSERLQLIVELVKMTDEQLNRTQRLTTSRQTHEVLGVPIHQVTLPVTSGRHLAVVVECAARNQILLNQGYNAFDAFSDQQRASMEQPPP
jgi:HPr kinase/phosphorylase